MAWRRLGALTLSTLSLVPRKLAAEEVARAIDLIRGRSRRDAQKIPSPAVSWNGQPWPTG